VIEIPLEAIMQRPTAEIRSRSTTRVIVAAAALMAAATLARPASAGPILTGTWYEFSFDNPGTAAMGCFPADPAGNICVPSSGTPTTFLDAPPWTFAAGAGGAVLTVTDAFESGDQFEVLDFGIPIGFTSVPGAAVDCGDDPVPCLADVNVSHGFFAMVAGNHSITIAPSAGGFGAAYLIVQAPVPEPATLALLVTGAAMTVWRTRRRRRDVVLARTLMQEHRDSSRG
jgi:hypothetical protein